MPFLSRALDTFVSRSLLGTGSFRPHWRSRLIHGFVRLDAAIPPMICPEVCQLSLELSGMGNLNGLSCWRSLPLCEH